MADAPSKTCPYCKAEIDADALKCRYCAEWVKKPTGHIVADTLKVVVINFALWIVFLFWTLFAVPRFDKIFKEYQMRLPALSEQVIETSIWIINYFYIVAVLVVVFLAVDGVVYWLLRRKLRSSWLSSLVSGFWTILMLAIPALAILLSVMGIFLTQIKLMEGLSK